MESKGAHTFPKGICPEVNIITWLEYELTYYDSAVYRINHYTTRTPPLKWFWSHIFVLYIIEDHKSYGPIGWGCRIPLLHLCTGVRLPNECPWYDTKYSDGETTATEIRKMRSTPSLQSHPRSLYGSNRNVWYLNCSRAKLNCLK